MSQITVYKCDYTGKLFESRTRYVAHLRKIARERNKERKIDKFKAWFAAEIRNVVCTPVELEAAIAQHWRKFRNLAQLLHDKDPGELVSIRFERMTFKEALANTHSAPLGMPQNFIRRNDSLPLHYPGWSGRLVVVTTRDSASGVLSPSWHQYGIYTGSGRSGTQSVYEDNSDRTYRTSHDVTLWAADWPAMHLREQLNQTARVLSGAHI